MITTQIRKQITQICLIGVIFFSGCTQQPMFVKQTKVSLGTIVEITVADQDKPRQFIQQAIQTAFSEIKKAENLFSIFLAQSDISRINAEACVEPVRVSPETIRLLEKSIEFSRLTAGAFDITMRPLMAAWGLTREEQAKQPSAVQLAEALDKVGYQHIRIDKQEQSVFLNHPEMSLDLGAIAKGYAVDKAIAALKQKGIQSALINAGGDIYCLGAKDKTKNWQVAVQHPRKPKAVLTVLELKDKASATSGDYQRYIEIKGRRFSHIIDPRTGYPCQDIPAAVTVLAEDCLTADALATCIFVLGPERGLKLVNQLENTEAIVVTAREDKLEIFVSQGLQGKLEFNL